MFRKYLEGNSIFGINKILNIFTTICVGAFKVHKGDNGFIRFSR